MKLSRDHPGSVPAPSVADAFGLTAAHDDRITDAREAMLASAFSLWTVATLVLIAAPLLLLFFAWDTGQAATVAEYGAPAAVMALSCLAMLKLPVAGQGAPHRRIAAFSVALVWIGISLGAMVGVALTLPSESRAAALTTLTGAAIVTTIAATPVRLASLAFILTLPLVLLASQGINLPSAIGLCIAAVVGIGLTRLARREASTLAHACVRANGDQRASLLVAEYEGHGSGWFWQTDRGGRLTYLSDKVAREMAVDEARQHVAEQTERRDEQHPDGEPPPHQHQPAQAQREQHHHQHREQGHETFLAGVGHLLLRQSDRA